MSHFEHFRKRAAISVFLVFGAAYFSVSVSAGNAACATRLRATKSGKQKPSKPTEYLEIPTTFRHKPPSESIASIRQLYVFGDSFSDVGNVFAASNGTEPHPPSYYDGRYSNGRNYVDFLGQMLLNETMTTETVFAYGGATTNNSFIPSYSTYLEGPVPDVPNQIQNYLASPSAKEFAPSERLYILWAGYNDYWYYINNVNHSLDLPDLVDVAEHVTSHVFHSVDTLVQEAGAERLLIVNLPNMAGFPDAGENKTEAQVTAYQQVISLHNSLLQAQLDTVKEKEPELDVRLLDAHALYQQFEDKSSWLGLLHLHSKCYYDKDNICADPYSFSYWDSYHPQTATHKRIADAAINVLL